MQKENQTNQTLTNEWQQNLANLKQIFDQIKLKKKAITNKQIIQRINTEFIKADPVLIHEFLQNYSNSKQLQASSTFSEVQSFFDQLKLNYQNIEEKYLKKDLPQLLFKRNHPIEKISDNEANNQRIFERNKINFSKFIKDENKFYTKSLNENLQKIIGSEYEVGIPAQKVKIFLKSLFQENSFVKVFRNEAIYFETNEYEQQIADVLKKYVNQVKELPENSFELKEIYINEEQVLDFLTFWLKRSEKTSSLFILYARTQLMMSQLVRQYREQILVSQTEIKQEVQISQQIDLKAQQMRNGKQNKQQPFQTKTKDLETKIKALNQDIEIDVQNEVSTGEQSPSILILRKYRETQNSGSTSRVNFKSFRRAISKEQKLEKLIPQFFTFACKNRARMLKGTTFDQIQDESRLMNLQKFINLCNYLQINRLIQKQVLIEEFKLHAINRLTLNVQRFSILVKNLIIKNQQVLDKLVSGDKQTVFKRKNQPKKFITNNLNSLSKYNYQLRSINGKTIQSISEELKQKKQVKELLRKQKDNNLLKKKKEGYTTKRLTMLGKYSKIQKSTVSESKLSFLNLNQTSKNQSIGNQANTSVERFNPQSLISNINEEQDKLWNQYQERVWKKEKNRSKLVMNQTKRNQGENESILEEALSKRLQRGNKVLQKIVSSSIKYYQ